MPNEAPDSLRSIAKARILDLLCEGEIEGLVNGARSIYLDETPIQNADGSYNHPGVLWSFVPGTNTQASIPSFDSTETTTSVGVEVKAGAAAAVVRTLSNTNLTAARVIVQLPALSSTNTSTGDISGTSVEIKIEVQPNGGAWQTVVTNTISGKSASPYERGYRFPLPGAGPWAVRVSRTTPDSTSSYLQNRTFWKSTGEIIDARLRYPNSAMVGIMFDAERFRSIPSRAYDLRLLRIQVPTNYDPITRVYTGSWDGTFKTAWSDNPAWVFYDLVTNSRYGLGGYIPAAQVDKWSLYTIGRYCDELVPDGFGGNEPRFRCNIILSSRAEAYKVINDLASAFRGMVFWSSGAITAVQDAPASAAYLYSPANVIDGLFTYSGSSAKARHTVALVTWNDPTDFFRQKVEYVEDRDGIARYGVVETQVAAVGCTSRGQAARVGRWLLFSERLETEVVTFRTGMEGAICRPGQIIKVADPARAGVRYGGRLQAGATKTSATLDAAVTLVAGQTYTFSALTQDGAVMEATVTNAPGTTNALTFSPALPQAPQANSMWVLASQAVDVQLFRVISVTETERNEFEVVALEHQPGKFATVENGLALQPRSISALKIAPDPVTNLVVGETLYLEGTTIRSRIDVSWTASIGASAYYVVWKRGDGTESYELRTRGNSIEIPGQSEGIYEITVYAASPIGEVSRRFGAMLGTSTTYEVVGKLAPPQNVTGFVVARSGDTLTFSWNPVPDIDLDRYELRRGDTWEAAQAVGSTTATTFQLSYSRGGSFLLRAVDTSGNYSAASAVVIAPDSSGINAVLSIDEASNGFPGERVSVLDFVATGAAQWGTMRRWSSGLTWTAASDRNGITTTPGASSGTYTSQPVDVGFRTTSVVSLDSVVLALGPLSFPWASYTQPWSTYSGSGWIWQPESSAVSVTYQLRISDDGVTWGPWVLAATGSYTFRFLQFRALLESTDPNYRPWITSLVLTIDVPDRVIRVSDVSVPVGGATIPFSPPFVGISTIQVTLQSAAIGDTFRLVGKSTSGVTVEVYDSTGTAKAGLVDLDAYGYGGVL